MYLITWYDMAFKYSSGSVEWNVSAILLTLSQFLNVLLFLQEWQKIPNCWMVIWNDRCQPSTALLVRGRSFKFERLHSLFGKRPSSLLPVLPLLVPTFVGVLEVIPENQKKYLFLELFDRSIAPGEGNKKKPLSRERFFANSKSIDNDFSWLLVKCSAMILNSLS